MKYSEQKGLISIIVPIYNNETTLIECLDSISSQTFKNWEAILVDDGSTNNAVNIIDEYAKKDSRFIAIHKQNEGTLLARKTGLENSKGEFIANIDHDDMYNPRFLDKMYSKIIETNTDFVWCKCQIDDEKNITYYMSDYKWKADVSENIKTMLIPSQGMTCITWNKLIKREIYAKVYFPDMNIVLCEDPVQMLQVAYHSKSATFVPENLYFHRFTGSSVLSNTTPASIASSVKAMISIDEILKNLFNGIIPYNVKEALYFRLSFIADSYFLLSKEDRRLFKNKFELLLPDFIKREKELSMKICLFLASKGIEFPFAFKEWIKNRNKNKLKEKCKHYEQVYIYGTGVYAERAVDFFEKGEIAINGFIVSDGFKKENEFKNKAIYEFSQIKPENKQIVVLALNDENKKQVIPILKKAKIRYFEFSEFLILEKGI
jgi:glycosyltransferase involved in cell wall biosynthesis